MISHYRHTQILYSPTLTTLLPLLALVHGHDHLLPSPSRQDSASGLHGVPDPFVAEENEEYSDDRSSCGEMECQILRSVLMGLILTDRPEVADGSFDLWESIVDRMISQVVLKNDSSESVLDEIHLENSTEASIRGSFGDRLDER
jgi:hypothetical protein